MLLRWVSVNKQKGSHCFCNNKETHTETNKYMRLTMALHGFFLFFLLTVLLIGSVSSLLL